MKKMLRRLWSIWTIDGLTGSPSMPSCLRLRTSEKRAAGSMRWGECSVMASKLKNRLTGALMWDDFQFCLFGPSSTESVLVEVSVTSCIWNQSLVNWGESSMAAERKGTILSFVLHLFAHVFVLLWYNTTPFSPPQPPQVSLKGKTIPLKRQRQRQGQRGPRPRQAPLQRQTALRAILTCQSWLIVLHFTCQPKAFIKFVPFQIHLCLNYFFFYDVHFH